MNKIRSVIIAVVAVQATPLADFHISQPSDCKCANQYIGPVPRVGPEQPDNLPEVPTMLGERVNGAASDGSVTVRPGTGHLIAEGFAPTITVSR